MYYLQHVRVHRSEATPHPEIRALTIRAAWSGCRRNYGVPRWTSLPSQGQWLGFEASTDLSESRRRIYS